MKQENGNADLETRFEELARRVGLLEDTHAVRTLHFKYGYYIDKCLYDEAVDLFAEDCTLYFLNGIYRGRAGARRLYCDWFREYFTGGHNGPVPGFLLDHFQGQDIVDVAPDGMSAKGRFRAIMQAGCHDSKADPVPGFPEQCWEGGIYENEYVKDGGIWKIRVLNYNMLWQADYGPGWAHSSVHLMPLTKTWPEDPKGPDELLPRPPAVWPDTRVVPFHYPHPVTGKLDGIHSADSGWPDKSGPVRESE
jgi:hypothetical protein